MRLTVWLYIFLLIQGTNAFGAIDSLFVRADSLKFSQPAKALALYQQLLVRTTLPDSARAKAHRRIGEAYTLLGKYGPSYENLSQGLALADKIGNRTEKGYCMIGIGNVFWFQKDYTTAKKWYLEAARIPEMQADAINYAGILQNIGICLTSNGLPDSALGYLHQALQLSKGVNDKKGIALIYNNIASVWADQGNPSKALAYSREAYLNYTTYMTDEERVYTLLNLARYSLGNGQPDSARWYINKAGEQVLSMPHNYILSQYYQVLAKVDSALGNYLGAYENFKHFKALSDSLYTVESSTKIANLDALYQLEMKEKEISNLLHTNRQDRKLRVLFAILILVFALLAIILFRFYKVRSRDNHRLLDINNRLIESEEQMRVLNENKDKFLSILAHDMRNPFHILKGFTELLYNRYDTMDEPRRMKYLENIHSITVKSYELLDNLLKWSRTQLKMTSLHTELVEVSLLVSPAIDLLHEAAELKKITIRRLEQNSVSVPCDKEMIRTVVRNLLSNAIKYSIPGSEILVQTRQLNQVVSIQVEDTGTGISEDIANRLFKPELLSSKPGTHGESGSGLGLLLSYEYVQKHKGRLYFEHNLPQGTRFIIELSATSDTA